MGLEDEVKKHVTVEHSKQGIRVILGYEKNGEEYLPDAGEEVPIYTHTERAEIDVILEEVVKQVIANVRASIGEETEWYDFAENETHEGFVANFWNNTSYYAFDLAVPSAITDETRYGLVLARLSRTNEGMFLAFNKKADAGRNPFRKKPFAKLVGESAQVVENLAYNQISERLEAKYS